MRLLVTALLLTIATSAVAQQQPQPTVQEQLYTACGNTNSQLAKMLDTANAELTKAQARIKELESKQEEKK